MTPLSEAFNKTEAFMLPSNGYEVTLKRPDVSRLAMENAGQVPMPITNQLLASFNAGEVEQRGWQEEDLPKLSKFMDTLIKASFVSPKITDTPDYDNGVIGLTDLTMEDRLALFQWAMPAEAAQVQSFRGEQNSRVGTAQDGKRVPSTAK